LVSNVTSVAVIAEAAARAACTGGSPREGIRRDGAVDEKGNALCCVNASAHGVSSISASAAGTAETFASHPLSTRSAGRTTLTSVEHPALASKTAKGLFLTTTFAVRRR
jgi:hypothetical protein